MGVSVPSPLARRAVLLLDLDGVLRRFDPLAASAIAAQYHLLVDRLAAVPFDPEFAHRQSAVQSHGTSGFTGAGEHLRPSATASRPRHRGGGLCGPERGATASGGQRSRNGPMTALGEIAQSGRHLCEITHSCGAISRRW